MLLISNRLRALRSSDFKITCATTPWNVLLSIQSLLQIKQFLNIPIFNCKVIYSYISPSLGFDKCLLRKAKHESSEIHWSYFHLGPLQGVIVCPPGFPVHTFIAGGRIVATVDAIKVRFQTLIVPPSSWAYSGTVSRCKVIIILIASCEWLTTVKMRKRVTSSSWIKKWLRRW